MYEMWEFLAWNGYLQGIFGPRRSLWGGQKVIEFPKQTVRAARATVTQPGDRGQGTGDRGPGTGYRDVWYSSFWGHERARKRERARCNETSIRPKSGPLSMCQMYSTKLRTRVHLVK